jgi:hypothetical protein
MFPGPDTICLDEILQNAQSATGDGLVVEARCRHLVFYVIGIGDVTDGEITFEEAESEDGPWAPIYEQESFRVLPNRLKAYHPKPGSFAFIRARISQPILGGFVTVRVVGAAENKLVTGPSTYVPIFTLRISGVDFTPQLQIYSVVLNDDLNMINTLEFSLKDEDSVFDFEPGELVTLRDPNDALIYAGTIERAAVKRGEDIRTGVFHHIEVVDFNQLPNRFLYANVFENETFEESLSANQSQRSVQPIQRRHELRLEHRL